MRVLISVLTAALLLGGAVQAKPKAAASNAMAPSTPAAASSTSPVSAASAAKAAPKPRTAISLDCSKKADAKGLHGKDRKSFRRGCMKPAKT